ncbi:unnamed protein product [Bemisia tabaci]|uniref:BTB domain-containing protein n=1 Tax=Bemisia tabaci TaxID=7038 RepID=A0A9P0EW45_BEMTA|nr:unnamed protein product [Bemisia tabaci]
MAGDNQQFCLRWNNHQSTLISVFDSLLESGTLVDCTLAAEGQYLKAHKVVLSACSPYLELLLSQHYEKHPIVILKDVKFQELKSMMDYMYRGEVNITQDQLATFLKAAESLQIKGLSESSGSTDDARDVGSTAKRPREEPPPRRPVPPHPQARLPHSSGLTIEPRRSIPHSSEMAPASPMKSREGSTSPVARKRRRRRPSGGDDASNAALSDSQLDTSNSCDLPPVSNQAQSTPISVPSILATPSASNNQSESDQPLETEALSRFPNTTGSELMVKTKMEPNTDQLIEPKTEYLEDINNEDSVEDLTLDDDDEMPGPSHADGSNQNFSQWQMAGDRSTDEVFMAAQEAVGAHRDSQGGGLGLFRRPATRFIVKREESVFADLPGATVKLEQENEGSPKDDVRQFYSTTRRIKKERKRPENIKEELPTEEDEDWDARSWASWRPGSVKSEQETIKEEIKEEFQSDVSVTSLVVKEEKSDVSSDDSSSKSATALFCKGKALPGVVEGETSLVVRCKICRKKFKSVSNCNTHVVVIHKVKSGKLLKRCVEICRVLNSNSFM